MADEFNSSTNWWERGRYDTGADGSTSSSNSSSGLTSLGSFPWQAEVGDVKRSSMESVSVSDSSGVDLNMMGLGLSSQGMDWNHTLFRGDKGENSFRSMLQGNLSSSSNNYQQESRIQFSHVNWKEQINRGFSLDQPQFSPHGSSSDSTVTCQGMPTSFQLDSPAAAAAAAMYGSPSIVFQGLLGTENQGQHPSFDRPLDYPYGGSYAIGTNDQLLPPWPKVPQFFRNSPSKQTLHSQVNFSNNAPFWNASANTAHDVRPSFYPSLQPHFPTTNFEERTKQNISEVRDSNAIAKKSGSETSTKRPRNETASTAFKVKKEKMGDRITALQQLVSPFGKTDTASVLSEAIEYIKFLHEQVNALSAPYMKSGAPTHHLQSSDKLKDPEGSQKQDLRSRGLCLVPVSSTFPVTHETTVDFWNPTFGGTFR